MTYQQFENAFVRDALAAIDGWGNTESGLFVQRLGALMWRIRLGDADGPQVLFLRVSPSASYLEPYLNDPTDEEVAMLREAIVGDDGVVFPYLRGGRGRGALLRVRTAADLEVVRQAVVKREKTSRGA
ncbi:MAG: hypothetical protein V3V35_02560 [Dehalococcoidia bacterium]